MKIGFFTDTYTPQINGVVTSINTFKEQLEKNGHKVYIFAPTPKQKEDNEKIIRFPSVKFLFQPEMRVALPYSQQAVNILKKINLDIIHSHDPFSIGIFGLFMARKFNIPYLHTYHTLYPEYVHYIWNTKFTQELAKKISKDFCNNCDLIIAPSTKIKKFLLEWGVSKPVKIIPTGVNLDIFKLKNNHYKQFRSKYNISDSEKILTFVGRVAKEKNIELIIESLNYIKSKNVKLLIIGNGPHKNGLEKLAKQKGLKEKVLFLGYLPKTDVISAYKNSEIFVFSSKTETQGLVVVEAMASGLPIVAVSDLAIKDMVKNNINGYLVRTNAKDMASKIDKLLANDKLHKKMSNESLLIAKELSAEKQTARLEKIYLSLIRAKKKKVKE